MERIPLEEFSKLYKTIFNNEADPNTIERSYIYWIDYQTTSDNTPKEEKTKHKYVIWDEFPTAESWINKEKKNWEDQLKRSEFTQSWLSKPWYERETSGNPIQKQLIDAFIKDNDGLLIRQKLLMWDLPSESLFDAIKHFSKFIDYPQTLIDSIVVAFLANNKQYLDEWGRGVCDDGGRVFRTLMVACNLFYDQQINGKKAKT